MKNLNFYTVAKVITIATIIFFGIAVIIDSIINGSNIL